MSVRDSHKDSAVQGPKGDSFLWMMQNMDDVFVNAKVSNRHFRAHNDECKTGRAK